MRYCIYFEIKNIECIFKLLNKILNNYYYFFDKKNNYLEYMEHFFYFRNPFYLSKLK